MHVEDITYYYTTYDDDFETRTTSSLFDSAILPDINRWQLDVPHEASPPPPSSPPPWVNEDDYDEYCATPNSEPYDPEQNFREHVQHKAEAYERQWKLIATHEDTDSQEESYDDRSESRRVSEASESDRSYLVTRGNRYKRPW
jgi:hypothetical protein